MQVQHVFDDRKAETELRERIRKLQRALTAVTDEDVIRTAFIYKQAKAPASADVAQVPVVGTRKGDGELKIGTILPQTGSLAFLGPPEFAGVDVPQSEDVAQEPPGIPTAFWRSVGPSHNVFVTESFIDELAAAAGSPRLTLFGRCGYAARPDGG